NGKLLWESGIVSGLPADGNDTPTGVYFVKGKETNVVLKGKINPKTKKPEYESPVAYWIPFIGNSYGLHDASWQPASAFNDKTAYQWRGSHGCVNLPTDKVAQLYDIIEVDDPVIIHW
ncbi:MAG: L,D-transpeptidase, partial [Eggerthellaceae bacterium]|nr:L,D-transpeptidase [Eggerthellaceae bacterium]